MDRGGRRDAAARDHPGSSPVEAFVDRLPVAIASLDAIRRVRFCNPAFERLLTRSSDEVIGRPVEDVIGLANEQSARLVAELAAGRHVRLAADVTRPDGTPILLDLQFVPRMENGLVAESCCVADDLTDRAAPWAALRVAEEKFARVFSAVQTAMSLSTADDHRFIDVNDTWVALTGYRREEAIGHTPLDLNLFEDPEDFYRLDRSLARVGHLRNIEIHFRNRSGATIVGALSAEEFTVAGEHLRLAVVDDLTPLRRLQEDLSRTTRGTLAAQEEERARVAAELHDDIGQRVSLLSFGIEQLKRDVPKSSTLEAQLDALSTQVREIAAGLRTVSHDLQPPKLAILGLDRALHELCRQFEVQSGVDVTFSFENQKPSIAIPKEVSMTVFRVTQEALTNALKHSGARRVDVSTWISATAVYLNVRDFGRGFDPSSTHEGTGLGLSTMRERVAALNGTFRMTSTSGFGTMILVRIPIGGRGPEPPG
jgi:PAS domain S-box-containing protein